MIVLLIISLVSVFVYKKTRLSFQYYYFIWKIGLLMFFLFSVEYFISDIDYMISDEMNYYAQESSNIASYIDRFTWYFLNKIIINYDILPSIALKLINIPILILFLLFLYKIFENDKLVMLTPFMLPYLLYIATKDFRDILILLLIVQIIYFFYRKKFILFFLAMVGLFFTRNFMIFVLIGIFMIYHSFKLFKTKFSELLRGKFIISFKLSKKKLSLIIVTIFFVIIGFWVLKPIINKKLNSYVVRIEWFLNKNHDKRLAENDGIKTGNNFLDYAVNGIRYAVTPLPTSLFARIIKGEVTQFGYIDDIVRMLNQSLFYLNLIYLLINLKTMKNAIKNIREEQLMVLLILLSHVIIYTLYSFGTGHSRIKIPFQLGLVLLSILTVKAKRLKVY